MTKKIILKDASKILRSVDAVISDNRAGVAIEVLQDLDGQVSLVVHKRWTRKAWWDLSHFTIRIAREEGIDVAILPDNMPVHLAAEAINRVVGNRLVEVPNLGALCPQCRAEHGEWIETEAGLHCALCGWIVGTQPKGHVQPGTRFWLGERVVIHSNTRVRVVAAHNQATAHCAVAKELWARPGELPENPVEFRQVREMVPGYEYIQVEVVELPQTWDLPRR